MIENNTEATLITTSDIKLYDITPMDYFSKTQTPLSKSQVFRDELWRRRHRQTNGSGTSSSACGDHNGPNCKSEGVDIETVLTRNMSKEDLKRLIEHQMVEAMKLVRLYSTKDDGSGSDNSIDFAGSTMLSESCTSINISVSRTPDFPAQRRRIKSCKIVKQRNQRRITL